MLAGFLFSCYATDAFLPLLFMPQKHTQKIFHLNALIDGRIVRAAITFSPAPLPGIFTELARFEAQRLLALSVRHAIRSGDL